MTIIMRRQYQLCCCCCCLLLLIHVLFPTTTTRNAAAASTIDHPIASSSSSSSQAAIYYLDGDDWIATTTTTTTTTYSSSTSSDGSSSAETVRRRFLTIPGKVPGDVITDLQRAGIIGDPYYELNWIHNSSLWNTNNNNNSWTYQRNFSIPKLLSSTSNNNTNNNASSSWLLVFDGVKMGARVSVNHKVIGIVKDQFLRYTFELPSSILKNNDTNNNNNLLQVSFDNGIDEEGRFMACTGGWDWAPYSYTTTKKGGAPSFSKGIWKSVYLVQVSTLAITHMTPHTTYLGSYPTKPLLQDNNDNDTDVAFLVNITVHLWVPPGSSSKVRTTTGYLKVEGDWGQQHAVSSLTKRITVSEGNSAISLQLRAQSPDIQLWWPTGMGEQPLYHVKATFWKDDDNDDSDTTTTTSSSVVSTTRRIGFRVFALVTTNDTDITQQQQQQNGSSGTHGMFFRINGAAIYSRGANVVPMEELEGRIDTTTNNNNNSSDQQTSSSSSSQYAIMVQSAVDAGMNTLRVWGGGIFFPRDFYDACDEYGILLYHDMQYTSDTNGHHGPNATSATQEAELRHQIRRLSHHPSIVLWDGVNEVVVSPDDPSSEVFASFVMTIVAQEDPSRAIWPSSPAAGWVTGVNTLYGTPNGREPLSTHGGGHIWDQGIETHAPYQLGSGWPSVNGGDDDTCWDRWHLAHTPPILLKQQQQPPRFGVHEKNVYASEFGVTGSPSFESLSATLARTSSSNHWSLHGGAKADTCQGACQEKRTCTGTNVMAQRNYACDAGIRLWFGSSSSSSITNLDDVGEYALKRQTYLCQLVQALDQKSVIEERRSQNQFGALVWMLNDIWPSISWGSLEYGSSFADGQLAGGRWKPMHYFYKRSLFRDVIATCGVVQHGYHHSSSRSIEKKYDNDDDDDWICYIKNDRPARGFRGTITLTSYSLLTDSNNNNNSSSNGTPNVFLQKHVILSDGPGAVQWFRPGRMPNPNTTVVECTVVEEEEQQQQDDNDDTTTNVVDDVVVVSQHLLSLTMPKNFLKALPRAKVTARVSNVTNADGTIDIYVTTCSEHLALWVVLTSGAQGRFSDNAFFLPATTTKTIQFVPFFGDNDPSSSRQYHHLAMLQQTLRVEDLSEQMSPLYSSSSTTTVTS